MGFSEGSNMKPPRGFVSFGGVRFFSGLHSFLYHHVTVVPGGHYENRENVKTNGDFV